MKKPIRLIRDGRIGVLTEDLVEVPVRRKGRYTNYQWRPKLVFKLESMPYVVLYDWWHLNKGNTEAIPFLRELGWEIIKEK